MSQFWIDSWPVLAAVIVYGGGCWLFDKMRERKSGNE